MALDFYDIDDNQKKKLLFSIDETDFEILSPLFDEFERKTSVMIDLHADTKIYSDHLDLLVKLIDQNISGIGFNASKEEVRILNFFRNKFFEARGGVLVIGD